jgi:CheY-like chemotaxis protein
MQVRWDEIHDWYDIICMTPKDESRPDFEDLDADEREIWVYLKSCGDLRVSGKEIARRAGGKKKYQENPKWAGHVLSRMAEKGIVELDTEGRYRLKAAPATEKPPDQPEPETWSCRDKRILFVDDDEGWRLVVSTFLQDAGGKVLTAEDGTGAMSQAEGARLDLVILDLDLDGESGLELMKYLRRNHPDTPMILYTGQSHDDAAIQAMLRLGAFQYLRKGPLEELRLAIQMALKK